jgi:molybdate transport system regulatory protein
MLRMIPTSRLDVRLRIDFGPASSIGPGKIALLEHIDRAGSLSQAARELGLSYRRAWLLLDDLNHSFTEPVATTSVGGVGGGGVQLTAFAQKLITSYREVEREALEATRTRFAELLKVVEPEKGFKSRLRRFLTRRSAKSKQAVRGRSRSVL